MVKTMTESLTLLIPTFNRPNRLRRLLEYYQRESFTYKVMVLDSSRRESADENEHVIDAVDSSIHISYEYVPQETNVLDKFIYGAEKADSEYIVACADDDFIVSSSIDRCVDFLRQHPDFSAAQGYRVQFGVVRCRGIGPKWEFGASLNKQGESLLDDEASRRLLMHLGRYQPTFYAVQCRKFFLESLKTADAHSTDHQFGELISSSLLAIWGKIMRFEIPYDITEVHAEQYSYAYPRRYLAPDEEFDALKRSFQEILVRELAESDGENEKAMKEVVHRATETYFDNARRKHLSLVQNKHERQAPGKRIRQKLRDIPLVGDIGALLLRILRYPARLYARWKLHPEIKSIRKLVLRHARSMYEN
jgi:glycosyltransferase domain-containing protein